MRLIDADAFKEAIKNDMYIVDYGVDGAIYGMYWSDIENAIDEQPSADPEIIRCKDCKHSEHWYRDRRRCFLWHEEGVSVFNDGFCNYAERIADE